MKSTDEIIGDNLIEQIGLEEQLCGVLSEQIRTMIDEDAAEAKNLLIQARDILEAHYTVLNQLLDTFERREQVHRSERLASNGDFMGTFAEMPPGTKQVSRILRDDYSALNLVTMSNTLLHTTGLALKEEGVAGAALKHLEKLAPVVIAIGELAPKIATKELHSYVASVDLSVAKTALINTQRAWKKAG